MLTVRRMKEEDVGWAAVLEAENFAEPWTEASFLETLRLDYAYYYVAEIREESEEEHTEPYREMAAERAEKKGKSSIAGICGLRNMAGEGEITNVSVDLHYRRRGVASAMLRRVLEDGQKLGIADFTLEVRCSNLPAIRLYEKFGFTGEGVRKGFYANPREDALIMWKRQEADGTITTVFTAEAHV